MPGPAYSLQVEVYNVVYSTRSSRDLGKSAPKAFPLSILRLFGVFHSIVSFVPFRNPCNARMVFASRVSESFFVSTIKLKEFREEKMLEEL